MNAIDPSYLERCISTLERSLQLLNRVDGQAIEYDMYRSACVKELEIILEMTGKLLKKVLKPYFHSSKEVDKLFFKDIFRHCANHSLMTTQEAEKWMIYRDNRNTTAHDYGIGFAEETLSLLPEFILDAKKIINIINEHNNA